MRTEDDDTTWLKFLIAAGINPAEWKKQHEERDWLRKSLQSDLAPDWLIEMVLERWNQR